jgi:L-asparaginase / beta-aspartyl-peptidase
MTQQNVAIAIHGGAGDLARYKGTGRIEEADDFLSRLIDDLHQRLSNGASAMDVVTYATVCMEDVGLFHAGKGSSPNSAGIVEQDASIMNGRDLSAGAVAQVRSVKNVIKLARIVAEDTPHVLVGGTEADALAVANGLDTVDESYFIPCDLVGAAIPAPEAPSPLPHGTVGAVARDINGNVAAATSTGGTLRKAAGRIGDTPIIGAGTYAKNAVGAVSSTGVGEYFMREVAAYQVLSRIEHLGESVGAATGYVMQRIHAMGGLGGMIAVGPRGEVSSVFNTTGMYRASIDAWGRRVVAVL